jgi:hypothetical protein
MSEKVLKRSRLKEAAKELNKKVKPGLDDGEEAYEGMNDDGIDLDAKSTALKKVIKAVGEGLVTEEDDLSDETWEVLEALGACERPKEEAVAENEEEDEEEEETTETEDEEEEEAAEEEEAEASLAETVEATKKLADLKELVEEHDEFKKLRKKLKNYSGLQGPKQLKADMFKALGVEAPAKQEKASKSTKSQKSAKSGVMAERIAFFTPLIEKGKYTKKELIKKAQTKFPDATVAALQTILTDAKNPKYNKFDRLVIQNEDKTFQFKE